MQKVISRFTATTSYGNKRQVNSIEDLFEGAKWNNETKAVDTAASKYEANKLLTRTLSS